MKQKSRKPTLDEALAEIDKLKQRVAELEKGRTPPPPHYPSHPGWRDGDNPNPPRPYWTSDITCQSQEIDVAAMSRTIIAAQ